MCGIVGYIGPKQAAPILMEGLSKLEYRGYDSAGIAVHDGTKMHIHRAPGKLAVLAKLIEKKPLSGHLGIGHTRWATHGPPSEQNAHPHASGKAVVVHNGILENHQELRRQLEKKGRIFLRKPIPRCFAHLIDEELEITPTRIGAAGIEARPGHVCVGGYLNQRA